MTSFRLTADQLATYHRQGYLIVPQFISKEETEKL